MIPYATPLEAPENCSHASIIRAVNEHRHELDFEDAEIRIEVYSGEATVEIVIEAVNELALSDQRRFALLKASVLGGAR